MKSSLLLLIDASGSMGDPIGSGNSQVKIEAAKQAAIAALGRAANSGSVEVAVLAFSGDCKNPVPRYQDFTRDVSRLTQFINSLQPGSGTPMAEALLFANRYMHGNSDPGAATRMIMLLADGQNDCGDVAQAMASLKSGGIIFRHETVGFGIMPSSPAAHDLRQIATQTGGVYHHAADANQLADVFMEFVDTFSVIDMLGMFGRPGARGTAVNPQGQPKKKQAPGIAPPTSKPGSGELSNMLGLFKPKQSAAEVDNSLPAASRIDAVLPAIHQPLGAGRRARPSSGHRIHLRHFMPVFWVAPVPYRRDQSRPPARDVVRGAVHLRSRFRFRCEIRPWPVHHREPLRERIRSATVARLGDPFLLRPLGQQASRHLAEQDAAMGRLSHLSQSLSRPKRRSSIHGRNSGEHV